VRNVRRVMNLNHYRHGRDVAMLARIYAVHAGVEAPFAVAPRKP
jgi:hypothetical protein